MSPVNTFGSGLRVETNLNGEMVDNEEMIKHKNNYNHSQHPDQPWQQGYNAEQQAKELLEPKPTQIDDDPAIRAANNKDLKIKGIR
jgi:hypothetical protein